MQANQHQPSELKDEITKLCLIRTAKEYNLEEYMRYPFDFLIDDSNEDHDAFICRTNREIQRMDRVIEAKNDTLQFLKSKIIQ